jgi:hypothetical protein
MRVKSIGYGFCCYQPLTDQEFDKILREHGENPGKRLPIRIVGIGIITGLPIFELPPLLVSCGFPNVSLVDPCRTDPITVFTKNRDRLLKADVARKFFDLVVEEARGLNLMSDEHFTVDGTLLDACAGLKSFKSQDGVETAPPDDPGNPTVNFHGEKRSNETHQSTTDPEALLARKGGGKEAKLSYCGNVPDGEPQRAGGGCGNDAGPTAPLSETPRWL